MLFLNGSLFAMGPTIECRFSALSEEGIVGLDEIVAYTLNPVLGLAGDFEPYTFDISVFENILHVGIYVDGEPINGVQVPIINIINMPLGASIFGINTIFHAPVHDFISLRYECRKVLFAE